MTVAILQRSIPHYREALFEQLHERFGWVVVAARNFPTGSFLKTKTERAPHVRYFDFMFPDENNPYRCRVPIARILEELNPTAVIAEFSLWMSSTYSLLGRRALRQAPPVYFWSHGPNMSRGLGRSGLPYQIPRMALMKLADGHLVYSEEGRQFLAKFVDSDRISVVRNTLALKEGPRVGSPPRSVRTTEHRPALLTIGRITEEKDLPGLVRAFRALLTDFPDASLTIIGDGPAADRTRSEAGEMLGRRIFMPGPVHEPDELADYFASSDLAVFFGAVGLSVNHALTHGLPVVAFERTGSGPRHGPELAYVVDGVTGMRVVPKTIEAMVRALRDFLTRHPEPRQSFRTSIADFVDRNLTLEVMLDDFEKARSMLARHGVEAGGWTR